MIARVHVRIPKSLFKLTESLQEFLRVAVIWRLLIQSLLFIYFSISDFV